MVDEEEKGDDDGSVRSVKKRVCVASFPFFILRVKERFSGEKL